MDVPNASSRPHVPEDSLILYVVKSKPTSGANVVKVLMLIEALQIPHHVEVVPSPRSDEWFHSINPQKMVPALEDTEQRGGKRLNVWESGACLMYLAEKYDTDGRWSGKDLWERTQVRNWLETHSSGLGATAKFWLTWKNLAADPEESRDIGDSMSILNHHIEQQYSLLDSHLSALNQQFIGLPDRPTIADFVNLPFANSEVASMAGLNFEEWPNLRDWSKKMFKLDAVNRAWDRVGKFGV